MIKVSTYAGAAAAAPPFRGAAVSVTVHATRFGTDPDRGLSLKSRKKTFIPSVQSYKKHIPQTA